MRRKVRKMEIRVGLEPKLRDRLERFAEDNGYSLSAAGRQLIKTALDEWKTS